MFYFAEPLIFLTCGHIKNGPIKWGEDQELSFNLLKNKLLSSEVLKFPDFSKPFVIETDASSVGVGAVLTQVHDHNSQKVSFPSCVCK